jgi:hypothetical protein
MDMFQQAEDAHDRGPMNELRLRYKSIVLESLRIAVKGGVASEAYEDFMIDYLDDMVDSLSDEDFNYLLTHRKVPVRDIESDEEYGRIFTLGKRAVALIKTGNLTELEMTAIQGYCVALAELVREYQERGKGNVQ